MNILKPQLPARVSTIDRESSGRTAAALRIIYRCTSDFITSRMLTVVVRFTGGWAGVGCPGRDVATLPVLP